MYGGYKKFLITGGTGTFGKAFAKRLITGGAERVVLLGRHEAEMAQCEAALGQVPPGSISLRCFLGDVRDPNRLSLAFQNVDVVIHAAALKRIEQCQRDGIEAVRTNIYGTQNVIEACIHTGIKKCVGLSTDKASSPVNLYGATKLAAEHLLLTANEIAAGSCTFCVVRYGNVWGSRGSVIHQWKAQLDAGGRLRVTDVNATRFFMTIDDACDLVDRALMMKASDHVILPSYLSAYRVGDLLDAFRRVCNCFAHPIDVVGLPKFEKLHETLDGVTNSSQAERMSIAQLEEIICQTV